MATPIKWKLWAQNPEDYDDQGVIVTEADEVPEEDEEFHGINDPGKTGIIIRDLASGQKWAKEVYSLRGDVVAVEIF